MLEISDMIVLFLDRYLRREPEVGVDLDLRGPVRSARQRLHIRLEHVLAQRDAHLRGPRARHAVPRRDHVPRVDQGAPAPARRVM